jgi:hypothetical protein
MVQLPFLGQQLEAVRAAPLVLAALECALLVQREPGTERRRYRVVEIGCHLQHKQPESMVGAGTRLVLYCHRHLLDANGAA